MKEMKAPDKVSQKMTHDGAVTENLATGEITNISGREAEVDLSASEEPTATVEAVAERVAAGHGRHKARKAVKADTQTSREGSNVKQSPSSRLQFTDEERAAPDLQKAIRRSERAADQLDAAKAAIPTKKVLKTERVFDETAGKGKTRLHFEDVEKKPNGKMRFNPLSRPVQEFKATVHGEVRKVEHENVGVEAGHKGEELAEQGIAYGGNKVRSAVREHPGGTRLRRNRLPSRPTQISSTKRRSMTIRPWLRLIQSPDICKRSVSSGTTQRRSARPKKR